MASVGIYLVLLVLFVAMATRAFWTRAIGRAVIEYEPDALERVPEMARHAADAAKRGFAIAGFRVMQSRAARSVLSADRVPFERAIAVLLSEDRRTMLVLGAGMSETMVGRPVPQLISFAAERVFVTTAAQPEPYRPMPGWDVARAPGASVATLMKRHAARTREQELIELDEDDAVARLDEVDRAEHARRIELGEYEVRDGYAYHSLRIALLSIVFAYVFGVQARIRQVLVLLAVGLGAAIAIRMALPEDTRVWAAGFTLVAVAVAAGVAFREGYGTTGLIVLAIVAVPMAITGDGHWVASVGAYLAGSVAMLQMVRRKPSPAPTDERGEPRRGSLDRGLYALGPACFALGAVSGAAIFVYKVAPVEQLHLSSIVLQLMTLPLLLIVVVALLASVVGTFALPPHHRLRRVLNAIAWVPGLAFGGFIGAGELSRASEEESRDNARSIAAMLEQHLDEHGEYPATLDALGETVPTSVVGWHEEPFDYRIAPAGYELSYRSSSGRQYYWLATHEFTHVPP